MVPWTRESARAIGTLLSLWFIAFYRRFISPRLGKKCIYALSCSRYTELMVKMYGPLRGWRMGIARIKGCKREP